eukprot:sb/3462238/
MKYVCVAAKKKKSLPNYTQSPRARRSIKEPGRVVPDGVLEQRSADIPDEGVDLDQMVIDAIVGQPQSSYSDRDAITSPSPIRISGIQSKESVVDPMQLELKLNASRDELALARDSILLSTPEPDVVTSPKLVTSQQRQISTEDLSSSDSLERILLETASTPSKHVVAMATEPVVTKATDPVKQLSPPTEKKQTIPVTIEGDLWELSKPAPKQKPISQIHQLLEDACSDEDDHVVMTPERREVMTPQREVVTPERVQTPESPSRHTPLRVVESPSLPSSETTTTTDHSEVESEMEEPPTITGVLSSDDVIMTSNDVIMTSNDVTKPVDDDIEPDEVMSELEELFRKTFTTPTILPKTSPPPKVSKEVEDEIDELEKQLSPSLQPTPPLTPPSQPKRGGISSLRNRIRGLHDAREKLMTACPSSDAATPPESPAQTPEVVTVTSEVVTMVTPDLKPAEEKPVEQEEVVLAKKPEIAPKPVGRISPEIALKPVGRISPEIAPNPIGRNSPEISPVSTPSNVQSREGAEDVRTERVTRTEKDGTVVVTTRTITTTRRQEITLTTGDVAMVTEAQVEEKTPEESLQTPETETPITLATSPVTMATSPVNMATSPKSSPQYSPSGTLDTSTISQCVSCKIRRTSDSSEDVGDQMSSFSHDNIAIQSPVKEHSTEDPISVPITQSTPPKVTIIQQSVSLITEEEDQVDGPPQTTKSTTPPQTTKITTPPQTTKITTPRKTPIKGGNIESLSELISSFSPKTEAEVTEEERIEERPGRSDIRVENGLDTSLNPGEY